MKKSSSTQSTRRGDERVERLRKEVRQNLNENFSRLTPRIKKFQSLNAVVNKAEKRRGILKVE